MTDRITPTRKPCIALMGEFSAGKSTLANLLIGADPLPVQVIATQLPPVWICYGDDAPFREDIDGEHHAVDIHNLAEVPVEGTTYIKIFLEEDILKHCDLLDMPGISDPNMSSEVWERMISRADGVLWCSHATQAWRQSEAAIWQSLSADLYRHSLLLLTRIDKLTSERDRNKVIRRVESEVEGMFVEVLPISLLQATSEQDDYDAWLESGAGEFAKQFAAILQGLNGNTVQMVPGEDPDAPTDPIKMPAFDAPESAPQPALPEPPAVQRIVPRRVRAAR